MYQNCGRHSNCSWKLLYEREKCVRLLGLASLTLAFIHILQIAQCFSAVQMFTANRALDHAFHEEIWLLTIALNCKGSPTNVSIEFQLLHSHRLYSRNLFDGNWCELVANFEYATSSTQLSLSKPVRELDFRVPEMRSTFCACIRSQRLQLSQPAVRPSTGNKSDPRGVSRFTSFTSACIFAVISLNSLNDIPTYSLCIINLIFPLYSP
jgi:hypothetical protein